MCPVSLTLVYEAAKDVLEYGNVDLLCMLMYFCLFFPNNLCMLPKKSI